MKANIELLELIDRAKTSLVDKVQWDTELKVIIQEIVNSKTTIFSVETIGQLVATQAGNGELAYVIDVGLFKDVDSIQNGTEYEGQNGRYWRKILGASLQDVTDLGNRTSNSIVINSPNNTCGIIVGEADQPIDQGAYLWCNVFGHAQKSQGLTFVKNGNEFTLTDNGGQGSQLVFPFKSGEIVVKETWELGVQKHVQQNWIDYSGILRVVLQGNFSISSANSLLSFPVDPQLTPIGEIVKINPLLKIDGKTYTQSEYIKNVYYDSAAGAFYVHLIGLFEVEVTITLDIEHTE